MDNKSAFKPEARTGLPELPTTNKPQTMRPAKQENKLPRELEALIQKSKEPVKGA